MGDATGEVVGLLRPPGAGRVGVHRPRFVKQWLYDAPGLFDRVLAGEELVTAGDRVAEQALVGLGVLPRDFLEEDLEVGRLERLFARLLRVEAHPRARHRLDPHRHLVRLRRLAATDPEARRALQDDGALAGLGRRALAGRRGR